MYMCMYNRSTRVRLTVHWNKGLFTVVVERECVCVDLTRVPGYEGVNSEYKESASPSLPSVRLLGWHSLRLFFFLKEQI